MRDFISRTRLGSERTGETEMQMWVAGRGVLSRESWCPTRCARFPVAPSLFGLVCGAREDACGACDADSLRCRHAKGPVIELPLHLMSERSEMTGAYLE